MPEGLTIEEFELRRDGYFQHTSFEDSKRRCSCEMETSHHGSRASKGSPCNMFEKECSCCQEIAALDSGMLEAQRALEKMAARHRKLKSDRNRTHSMINRLLPPEIISTIFHFCLPSQRELDYSFEFERALNFSSLDLGVICREWRQIAWTTPGLWCQMRVLLDCDPTTVPRQVELVQQWLDRSGGLPLTLHIRMLPFKGPRPTVFHACQHPVLEIFKLYSKRWSDLYLRLWTPWISKMGADITGATSPTLRTLKFHPMGEWNVEPNTKLWQDIEMSPRRLRFLTDGLTTYLLGTSELSSSLFRHLDIKWGNLMDMEVAYLSWGDCAEILNLAQQLTRFTISNFGAGIHFSGSNQVVHSNLQYFSISGAMTNHNSQYLGFQNFISALHFPSLTELEYDVGPSYRPTRLSSCHYPAMFLRRLRDLKTLSIQMSSSLEGERYIGILESLPSLQHLYISDRDTFHDVTMALQPFSRQNALETRRPLLLHLAATYRNNITDNPPQNSPELFLPVLKTFGYIALSRAPPWMDIYRALGPLWEIGNVGHRPLRTLYIEFGNSAGELDHNLARRLWEVKESGIEVQLRDNDWYDELDNRDVFKELMMYHGLVPPAEMEMDIEPSDSDSL